MSKTKRYWLVRLDRVHRRNVYGPFSKKQAHRMLDLLIGEYKIVKEV